VSKWHRILQHNAACGVSWDKRHQSFRIKGEFARPTGLVRIMQHLFWRSYVKPRVNTSASEAQLAHRSRKRGADFGTMIHRQVERYVKSHGKKCTRLNQYTRAVLQAIAMLKLQPAAAEVPLVSTDNQLATAIDVLCTDAQTKTKCVVVELKTGYTGEAHTAATDVMEHAPLHKVNNSPFNQHQLQVAGMYHLLRTRYGVTPDASYVMRVNRDGVSVHRLREWAKGYMPTVFAEIVRELPHFRGSA